MIARKNGSVINMASACSSILVSQLIYKYADLSYSFVLCDLLREILHILASSYELLVIDNKTSKAISFYRDYTKKTLQVLV